MAYAQNAERSGEPNSQDFPIELHVEAIRPAAGPANSFLNQLILENPLLSLPQQSLGLVQRLDYVAWTSANTLLYTSYGTRRVEVKETAHPAKPRDLPPQSERPGIYEVAPDPGSEPHLLIENGFAPLPSPDNRFVAFYSAIPTGKEERAALGRQLVGLFLFDRRSKRRTLIAAVPVHDKDKGEFGSHGLTARWIPGNRGLVLLGLVAKDPPKNDNRGHIATGTLSSATITLAPQPQVTLKPLATVEVRNSIDSSNQEMSLVGTSHDGQYVLLKIFEPTSSRAGFWRGTESLLAIGLANGVVHPIAHYNNFGDIHGWDFIEEAALR